MLNKEVIKEYALRECAKIAYIMSNEDYSFSLIKQIIEKYNSKDELESAEEGEKDLDSLLDFLKFNPKAYEQFMKHVKEEPLNIADSLIEEMKNLQEVSDLSRRYFELHYPNKCARADTFDGSLDGHEIFDINQIALNTEKLLKDPKIKVVFEGQMIYQNQIARWDVMIKEEDGYILYEVKGTNNIYTKTDENKNFILSPLKKDYAYDIAFQYEVYTKAGLNLLETNFLFLNKSFVSKIETLTYPLDDEDCLNIFIEAKKTIPSGKNQKKIMPIMTYIQEEHYANKTTKSLNDLLKVLQVIVGKNKLPETKLIYGCRKAGGCLLKEICHPFSKDNNHIFNLTCNNRVGGSYHTCSRLIKEGIEMISEISDAEVELSFPPIKNDKISLANYQINFAKNNYGSETSLIDYNKIRDLINNEYKEYPLIFFDFETFSYPLPLVSQTSPWEKVCSQYSMHVVYEGYSVKEHDFKKGKGGNIEHYEFIGNPKIDRYLNPEQSLIKTLKEHFQKANIDIENKQFTLVVFNKNFEKAELKRMATKYPEHANFLNLLNSRVVDLLDFFILGYYYQKGFNGRVSLKVVQPELIKTKKAIKIYGSKYEEILQSLDYEKGIIKNGSIALDVYQSLLRKVLLRKDTSENHDLLLEDLKAYCKIDSWGTVIIFDILKELAKEVEV